MALPVTAVLAGIGGYGRFYLKNLLDNPVIAPHCRLVGVVDPFPETCPSLDNLRERGIPIHDSLESFFATGSAQVAFLASPIQFHCAQTCLALGQGAHVLCEKPLCATIQDARAMMAARDAAGRMAAVGYQWSYSQAIQDLKRDILDGLYGKPEYLKTLVLWPRPHTYYGRNRWAGAQRSASGDWILDSPVNNATAHYLHNMFFVLGATPTTSARPVRVTAEAARANPIDNYDTAVARIEVEGGARLLYVASHATDVNEGPKLEYRFERGTVTYSRHRQNLTGRFADGRVREYGDPYADDDRKITRILAVATGAETQVPCGLEAALSHTLCVNGIQDSLDGIAEFAQDRIEDLIEPPPSRFVVRGLDTQLKICYQNFILPSELGVGWARPGRAIELSDYQSFPSVH